MSDDDGYSDGFDDGNIEIEIKTLMGTTFDLKVSPTDTIEDIKKKIYRVEGIPIHQQNLLFQSVELKDTIRLCDSNIKSGSSLTLVPSMRGGPISTRRLSITCDHHFLKELKELLENSRDELNSGSKVSVLVFKEGDIINLFRVIENEDGSYSPYYNENVAGPSSKSAPRNAVNTFQKLIEDSEMCTKLATLRRRMEELNEKRQKGKSKSYSQLATCRVSETNSKSKDSNRIPRSGQGKNFSWKLLENPVSIDSPNTSMRDSREFQRNQDHQSENEEIALKDKHRTNPNLLQDLHYPKISDQKTIYNESKKIYSTTRENYVKLAKKRDSKSGEKQKLDDISSLNLGENRKLTERKWEENMQVDTDTCSSTYNMDNAASSSSLSNSTSSLICTNKDELKTNDDFNEKNSYLLDGLKKACDLNILEEEDFLATGFGNSQEYLINENHVENRNIFSRLPNLEQLQSPANAIDISNLLDISTRLNNNNNSRTLSPITTLNKFSNSNSSSSHSSNNSGNSFSLTNNSASNSRLFQDTKFYSTIESNNNQTTLKNVNKVTTRVTNTIETPLPTSLRRLETIGSLSNSRRESPILGVSEASVEEMSTKLAEQLHFLDDETNSEIYTDGISLSARNTVHLTRLVLSTDGSDRPKGSPNSIELEEHHSPDFWEIHEPTNERLKRSTTCKVGLVKHCQGLEYNYNSIEDATHTTTATTTNSDLGKYTTKSSGEYGGVCSGTNLYVPQYLPTTHSSSTSQQFTSKEQSEFCDLYFKSERRSPLYNRRNRNGSICDYDENSGGGGCSGGGGGGGGTTTRLLTTTTTTTSECSHNSKLNNDGYEFLDNFYEYFPQQHSTVQTLKTDVNEEKFELPPINKKKSRCNECSRKLNITNIYNCRCGRIFCSQHRYSEAHKCTYDYKAEGKKIIEQQNPLVTAQKIQKF